MTTDSSHASHASHMARNVAVAVLASAIMGLMSALILHGRDLVEFRTKIRDLEKRIDLISERQDRLRNPRLAEPP